MEQIEELSQDDYEVDLEEYRLRFNDPREIYNQCSQQNMMLLPPHKVCDAYFLMQLQSGAKKVSADILLLDATFFIACVEGEDAHH